MNEATAWACIVASVCVTAIAIAVSTATYYSYKSAHRSHVPVAHVVCKIDSVEQG